MDQRKAKNVGWKISKILAHFPNFSHFFKTISLGWGREGESAIRKLCYLKSPLGLRQLLICLYFLPPYGRTRGFQDPQALLLYRGYFPPLPLKPVDLDINRAKKKPYGDPEIFFFTLPERKSAKKLGKIQYTWTKM